ncbi:MAG: PilZ domain-containing protein [Myxococcota bacterium]
MTDAIQELFQRLCRQSQKAHVQPEDWPAALPFRFWKVDKDAFELKLETELEAGGLDLPRACEVWGLFENMGRIRTFRTTVIDVIDGPEGHPVAIRCVLPTTVGSEDRRKAYRVPQLPKEGLKAALVSGRRTWRPKLRNLSVTGAMFQLPPAVTDALPEEGRYVLMLEMNSQIAKVNCVIRRKESDGRCAVSFPGALRMGEVVPPPDLAKIVRLCEMSWLRRRSGKDKAA